MNHPIAELMMPEPVPIDPDDSLEMAQAVMGRVRLHLWPVGRDHHLLGMVCWNDLMCPGLELHSRHRVREVMSTPPCVARPSDDLVEAARRMGQDRLTCLPVG